MNIKIAVSRHVNKKNKRAIIYDCSERKYRKKISTGLYLDEKYLKNGKIFINEKTSSSTSLRIVLVKLKEKKEKALNLYIDNKWTYKELEQHLKRGINLYSIEEYVLNFFSKTKNKITLNDYINVVKVFKKHLKKENIHFNDILKSGVLNTFKFNAQKRGIKNTSINSYMKKMGVIMNKAHHDGFILERFKIPKFLIEKEYSRKKKINYSRDKLILSVNNCNDIFQVQALSIFTLLLVCGGMNPSDLMNYTLIKKESKTLINSILFDLNHDYMKFKKSKKGLTYKYIKIGYSIRNIIDIVKTLFIITHYKKYPFIFSSFTDKNKIFDMNIYDKSSLYKNIWNFYQRKLREVSSIKFSEAKSIYQEYLKEIEMTKNTSEIMFGNIKENEILKIKNLSATMENIEKAEQDVLREIGIDEINQIIINKLKLLNLDLNNHSFKKCKTPLEFSKMLKKINRYHKGL